MTGNVINLAERFAKKASPPAEHGATFKTAMKTLPFVSEEWRSKYWPEKMWADVPTNNYPADHKRGEEFARLTLGAMLADREAHYTLAKIFEAMVEDCARRRAKGGKGSRSLPAAVCGYLEVLAFFITVQCVGGAPGA